MSVEHLTQATNLLPSVPDMVIMTHLEGAAVAITTDPSLPPRSVAVDLEPPEAFTATYTHSNNLRVDSAADRTGGTVGLRVGPESRVRYMSVCTTEGDIRAAGTPEVPLAFGNLALSTNGPGGVQLEWAVVDQKLRRPQDAQIGAGVVEAGMVIVHSPQQAQ